jgi:carbon storage regulator
MRATEIRERHTDVPQKQYCSAGIHPHRRARPKEGANLMLVLSRQRDETIMIGDEVEITIVDIRGDKVRLGINAPRQVQVHRKEVYTAIQRENTQSTRVCIDDLNVADQNLRRMGKAIKPTLRNT